MILSGVSIRLIGSQWVSTKLTEMRLTPVVPVSKSARASLPLILMVLVMVDLSACVAADSICRLSMIGRSGFPFATHSAYVSVGWLLSIPRAKEVARAPVLPCCFSLYCLVRHSLIRWPGFLQ